MGKALSTAVVKSKQLDEITAKEWISKLEKSMEEKTFLGCAHTLLTYMKFKKLKFLIFILFLLPQDTSSNDKLEYFLYCNQIPEGSPFGLIFRDNEVAQIGIENFEKVLDYKESFQKKGITLFGIMFYLTPIH